MCASKRDIWHKVLSMQFLYCVYMAFSWWAWESMEEELNSSWTHIVDLYHSCCHTLNHLAGLQNFITWVKRIDLLLEVTAARGREREIQLSFSQYCIILFNLLIFFPTNNSMSIYWIYTVNPGDHMSGLISHLNWDI